jgi:hypothetical protein
MSDRNKDFLKRLASHRQIADITRALDASAAFGIKAAAIKSDKDLSIEGRTNKSKAQARAALRDVRDAAAGLADAKTRLQVLLDSIKPAPVDRGDLAAALIRSELRNSLKGMSIGERAALLLGEKADPEFQDAFLEAPAMLSGVEANMAAQVREQRLETLHPEASFQVEDLTREIEEAEAGFALARQDIQQSSGLDERAFSELVAEVQSRKNAPWLKKSTDAQGNVTVEVVPLRGGPARIATPDDLRDGKFYADHAAWLADRAA